MKGDGATGAGIIGAGVAGAEASGASEVTDTDVNVKMWRPPVRYLLQN